MSGCGIAIEMDVFIAADFVGRKAQISEGIYRVKYSVKDNNRG
jgi:hypothetical protein